MKLHAQWITGFVDGEGCFIVSVRTAPDRQTPVQLQPAFIVSQHKMDIQVLHALKAHFGCGQVYHPKKKGDNGARWKVRKLDHLLLHIIPFFGKYPLYTKKAVEFERFRRICLLLKDKVHLTPEGFDQCVTLARQLRVKFEPETTETANQICELHDSLELAL